MDASKIQIQLHGILSSTDNKNQTSRLGALLQSIGGLLPPNGCGPGVSSLGKMFMDFSRQAQPGVASLHLIYRFSALERLRSDEYAAGNQPKPPLVLDENNWGAYVWASDQLPSDPIASLSIWLPDNAFYKTYSSWANFNCLTNGYTDADGNPTPQTKTDRHLFGPYQPSLLRGFFGDAITDTEANWLNIYFSAGQQYMNLCDDLNTIVNQLNPNAKTDWDRFTSQLAQIAKTDIDEWFGPTVLLALAKSCQPFTGAVLQQKFSPDEYSGAVTIEIS